MTTKPTTADKMRGLPWDLAHQATNSVFCNLTVFGSVFILFVDELGLGKTQIGFLQSLLPFCGILALFIAPTVARFGLKRTYLIFWGMRKIAIAFLLLTPWVSYHFGFQGTFIYISAVMLAFAVCRAIAETALSPWIKEYVPDAIRGKYGAICGIVATLASAAAVAFAGHVIERSTGLGRYMFLIAVGVVFGIVSVVCSSFVPGGAPMRNRTTERTHFSQMMIGLRDRNFRRYLVSLSFIILGTAPLASFLPLFIKEQVGLSDGNIVRLALWSMLAGLLSSYLWGWTADRYGGKPVMLTGLYLMAGLPVCWLLIPRHSDWSNLGAIAVALFAGWASGGWGAGSNRVFYVSVVPAEHKTEYMALNYAWMGVVGGCAPLAAGRVLDACKGLTGRFLIFRLDPYVPLFLVCLAFLVAGVLLLRRVRAEGTMPPGQLARMFMRGNPLVAFESMVRYSLAGDEGARISTTERLGTAKSPLNVDELSEALSDPSFNVRYEAIVSIARTHPNGQLIDALIQVLAGNEPELSLPAAWALGRIGDRRAIGPLREALVSGYPLLQARSARALATLGDRELVPVLLERLRTESDDGLRIAYASALGTLQATEATGELLALLRSCQDESTRSELALALVRVIGREHYFIRLWRSARPETGTATSRAVLSLSRRLRRAGAGAELVAVAEDCAHALAADDLERGVSLLGDLIRRFPAERLTETAAAILQDCVGAMDEFGSSRIEYVLLSLHTLNAMFEGNGGQPNGEPPRTG